MLARLMHTLRAAAKGHARSTLPRMYAPAHVSTALAVKRSFPVAPLLGLMFAAQAIEFLWILLSYLGIEYQSVDASGTLHLDYLPYSHSILTGVGSASIAYAVIRW